MPDWFDLETYATVQERLAQFWQDHPDGSIRTTMVVHDGPEVVFEARLFRTPADAVAGIYTSGWAREIEGKTAVNRTSHLENCESSALGRALANLGYATDARRPSRSEMLKVARQRDEHEALLEYLRRAGPRLDAEATITVGDQTRILRDYVREHWATIKEQMRVAQTVAAAVQVATRVPLGGEPEREAA